LASYSSWKKNYDKAHISCSPMQLNKIETYFAQSAIQTFY